LITITTTTTIDAVATLLNAAAIATSSANIITLSTSAKRTVYLSRSPVVVFRKGEDDARPSHDWSQCL